MANKAKQSLAINTPLNPDADLIHDKLLEKLTNNGDRDQLWTDLVTGATGSFITRMVSSVGSDAIFAVERGQHEAFLQIGRRPSSIYAGTQMLGVHIQRKIPSSITARIARDNSFGTKTILEYSSWTINGLKFFNRQRVYFSQDIKILDVNLHLGQFITESFVSDGTARQSFIFGAPGFATSDVDVMCSVTDLNNDQNPVPYKVVTEGIWEYEASSMVAQVTTTIDGQCKVEFGNGISGFIPPVGHEILMQYVKVIDTPSNNDLALLNLIPIDSSVFCLTDNEVAGLTTSTLSRIVPERNPSFYSRNAPYIRSGKKFGNTRDNMRAIALEYPGVIDCVLRGQAEINPDDVRLMNIIEACLLTQTKWSTSEKNQFIYFMHNKSCSTRHFIFKEAEPVILDFNVTLLLAERAQRDSAVLLAKDIIDEFFVLDEESLGKRFSEADLTEDFKQRIVDPYGKLVTYAKVLSPEDARCLDYQYFTKGAVTVNASYDPKDSFRIVLGTAVPGGRIGVTG